MAQKNNWIRVIGAKEHNLKNINVDIPKDELTVITGPSGSGKVPWRSISSLRRVNGVIWSHCLPMHVNSWV